MGKGAGKRGCEMTRPLQQRFRGTASFGGLLTDTRVGILAISRRNSSLGF